MQVLLVNIALYVFFVLYIKKHYRADISVMIMPYAYLITAVINLLYYLTTPSTYILSYCGFIYLFVIYVIAVLPLLKYRFKADTPLYLAKMTLVKYLVALYCCSATIVLMSVVPKSILAFELGDWLAIRNEMYYGDNESYSSFLERVAINLSGYLRFFTIFYFFYLLSRLNNIKRKPVVYIIGIMSFMPTFLTAVALAARGTLFQLVYEFIICFFIFRKQIDAKIIRVLKIIIISILSVVVLFTAMITLSRFDSDSSSSVFFYLGHSMLTFNYGVYDSLVDCANGKWLLGDYSALFTGDKSELVLDKLGVHCGSAFITVFGSLYIDFGFVGTVIFILFFNILISKSLGSTNNRNDFGRTFFYAYLTSFFLGGIFVYPVTYGIKVLFTFFIYLIISKSWRFKA